MLNGRVVAVVAVFLVMVPSAGAQMPHSHGMPPPAPHSHHIPPAPHSHHMPPAPHSHHMPPAPHSHAMPPAPHSHAMPPAPHSHAMPPAPHAHAPHPPPAAVPPGPPVPAGPPPPGPPPPPGMGPSMGFNSQVQSSHCRYLVDAPSPWGTNASPFRLYTRSHSGEIRRGYPIEVSILPFYDAFKFFNFTDFALWAEPHLIFSMAQPPVEPEKAALMGGAPTISATPPGPNDVSHLGVWQVFPKYAGGASTLKCNIYTQGEDTVGSFEGRMLELLKAQFPFDRRLVHFHPSARHGAAFLWYPDENTMGSVHSVKFVAKLKSFGQWFRLESGNWRVYRPPQRRRFISPALREAREYQGPSREPFQLGAFLDTYQNMRNHLRYMEHRLEKAGAPGV